MSIDTEIEDLNDELIELHERMGSVAARLGELLARKKPADAPLLSVAAVATKVGVSRATLYRMIDNGEVTVVTAGATMKVPSHWVDQYIRGEIQTKAAR